MYTLLNEHVFDAVVWTTAKGYTLIQPQIIDEIIKVCGNVTSLRLAEEDKLHYIYDVLRSSKTLVIIDNLETVVDTRVFELIERIPHPSRTIVTTRNLTSFENQHTITLSSLPSDASHALMVEEIERLALTTVLPPNSELARSLIQSSFGNPLALKWVIGQIKYKGRVVAQARQGQVQQPVDLLLELVGGSWELLSADSRQLLMALALFPEPILPETLRVVTELTPAAFDRGLAQLTSLSLIELENRYSEVYYTIHPLTRAFAQQQIKTNDDFAEATQRRMADHYLHFLTESQAELNSLQAAYDRIDAELQNILHVLDFCHTKQLVALYTGHLDQLVKFLWNRGYWDLRIKLLERGVGYLDAETNGAVLSRCCCYLAEVYSRRSDQQTALNWMARAQAVLPPASHYEQALIDLTMGKIALRSEQFEKANRSMQEGQELLTNLDLGQVSTMMLLADIWDNLGDLNRDWGLWLHEQRREREARARFDEAQNWYFKLLALAEEQSWHDKQTTATGDLGHLALYLGNLPSAEELLQRALAYAQAIQRKHTIAYCYLGLGQLRMRQTSAARQDAITYLQEAARIYETLGQQQVARAISQVVTTIQQRGILAYFRSLRNRRRWARLPPSYQRCLSNQGQLLALATLTVTDAF